MKAVIRNKYGSPDVLSIAEYAKPSIKEDEILIKVEVTTVNRTDCGILRGKPFLIRFFTGLFRPKSNITGTDFAGVLVEKGAKVRSFKIGDRLWGFNDEGIASHAEFMKMKETDAIAKIPDNISFEDAVACAEGAHYALNFINKLKINEKSEVLVNGATGAIGSASLQLLKYYGAKVTAVGNTKNIELLKSLGADKVIDYLKEDFTKDNQCYHYIFDAVGKSTFSKCKHLLLPKGCYLSSELGPNAQNLYLPLITLFRGNKRVIFPIPSNCRKTVLFINQLLFDNKFKAVIDKTYTMDEIQNAYEYVESGEKTGSVILEIHEI